jgi:ribosomal protein L11 methyltransferase
MDYLELSVAVRPEAVDAAAELLQHYAPAGVSIEPPFRALDEDGGLAFDDRAPVRLRAWVAVDGTGARSALTPLRRELRALGAGLARPLRARAVRAADWREAWKRHFPVLHIGKRLVLRPSWRRYKARPADIVIELDPGLAFGTGQHETTRLCLEALEERVERGDVVLDLGCGSGILAVAAARLGASRADAVDVDPSAVVATSENAARNGVQGSVRAAQGSLGEAWPLTERPVSRYDLILANISARVIRELAVAIAAALRPGGVALVSGIIAEHEEACCRALEQAGARVIERRADGDWRLLIAAAASPS